MTPRTVRTASATIALLLGLFLSFASGASGQSNTTTVVIHKAECPADYAGGDPFADCHDNRLAGVTFEWGNDAPGAFEQVTTDVNGVAVIETTTGVLIIEEIPPYDLESFSVYCSTNDGADEVTVTYASDGTQILFLEGVLPSGGEVVCDWYNVPVVTSDDGTDAPVTLPSTGVGPASDGIAAEIEFLSVALIAGAVGLGLRRRSVW